MCTAKATSYIFYLLLQQSDNLPLTVNNLTLEVDDYPEENNQNRMVKACRV